MVVIWAPGFFFSEVGEKELDAWVHLFYARDGGWCNGQQQGAAGGPVCVIGEMQPRVGRVCNVHE